jgi:hypothetical protein
VLYKIKKHGSLPPFAAQAGNSYGVFELYLVRQVLQLEEKKAAGYIKVYYNQQRRHASPGNFPE